MRKRHLTLALLLAALAAAPAVALAQDPPDPLLRPAFNATGTTPQAETALPSGNKTMGSWLDTTRPEQDPDETSPLSLEFQLGRPRDKQFAPYLDANRNTPPPPSLDRRDDLLRESNPSGEVRFKLFEF